MKGGSFLYGKKRKSKTKYKKFGIKAGDDIIDSVMSNKERLNSMMRLYKQEELESMNYILGKPDSDVIFTEFEIEAMNKIDLFDRKVIKIAKTIWDNKDNPEELNMFQKILNEEVRV